MRSGALTEPIEIQRAETTLDDYGTPQEAWSLWKQLRAQVLQSSTEEFIRAYGASTESTVVFRTWFVHELTLQDRIVYQGRVHEIVEIKPIGRRQWTEIRTVAKGSVEIE